ncbi:RHS repeat-associated core domain-containing protein [Salinibacterium sp. SWN167]|uniref:RHS repeat-associated core domain-containing protein n=1 Tax=Salinibacterium sp. SWN167 TaxID=2792054 RepID=UPI0027DBA46F|nr:RHS repeat-associated core domain-containing protein [Salinibacterium sp. SWN167]
MNTSNGEYYETLTDLAISGIGPGVVVGRNYSSTLAAVSSPFGFGWNASFSAHLVASSEKASNGRPVAVDVIQENGSIVKFALDSTNSYVAPARINASLLYSFGDWVYTRNQNEIINFGPDGLLVNVSDRRGNTVSFEHDQNGVLTSLVGSGDRRIDIGWSGSRVASLTDHAGRQVQYGYDIAGNLVSVTSMDGSETHYVYDGAHRLTQVIKPGGATTTNTYDTNSRVVSQSDPVGRVTTFEYTPPTTTVQHPDGSLTVDEYSEGLLVAQTLAAGTPESATTRMSYNNENRLIRQSDALGRVSSYTYDERGNQTSIKDPRGAVVTRWFSFNSELISQRDQLGREASWSYDANGGVVSASSPSGRTQSWTRNSDGSIASWTDANGNVSTYLYDDAGRVVSATDANSHTEATAYDLAGRVVSTANGLDESVTYTRDAMDRVLSITDPINRTTAFTYDQRGNLVSTLDAKQQVTGTIYNLADEAVAVTNARGKTTTLLYTPRGQVASVVDSLSRTTSFGYNLRGELVSTTDPLGRTAINAYDAAGQQVSTTSPSGAITSRTFDPNGNIATQTDANSKTTLQIWNADGTLESVTDPLGRYTAMRYTPDGELAAIEYPNNASETYTYDSAGNRILLINADGEQTSYAYDSANLMVSRTEPGGLVTGYEYDAANRPSRVTSPDSSSITYTYDDAGQRTRTQFSETGSTDVVVAYDELGRRTSMVDESGTSTYVYDSSGNLTEYTAAGRSLSYAYDDADQLSALTYPGVKTVDYTWDAGGQMSSMTDWENRTTTFGWSADSQLTSQALPNAVTESRIYDPAGQTKTIKTATPLKTLGTYTYNYDAAGQITSDVSADAIKASLTRVFTYDPISQLASSKSGTAAKLTYTATPGKNLTKVADGTKFTYNAAQQVIAQKPVSGASTAFAYDANGARTSAIVAASGSTPAQTTGYAYNAADALDSVTLPGSATAVTYTADGDNLRQSRTKGAATTRYLWDVSGSLPLLVEAGSTSYLYGPSHTPLAQIDSAGDIDYLHADLIGSTRMTSSGSGVVTSTNAYDPFGKRTHTGTRDSAFGFSGNLTDVDTGLIYMRARDYDPRTGQFLTVDPALYFTGDPYAYVSNNPLLRIDPTGLWDFVSDVVDPLAVSMMRGSLAGATSAIVGFGDGASLGFTDLFRESVGLNCVVDKGSWYFGGSLAGSLATDVALGAGVATAAARIGRVDNILSIGNTAVRYERLSTRPVVVNSKLDNIVENLYSAKRNPLSVGNGTTADAIRSEALTGLATQGRFHNYKGQVSLNGLNNLIAGGNLSSSDYRVATMLRNELLDVLVGK